MPIEVPAVRILIVDDDRAICDYMQTLLEKDGFVVKTKSDPTAVEDEVRQGSYHVIILDLMMPKLDGIEVLKRIRSFDSDVAVIIFTASRVQKNVPLTWLSQTRSKSSRRREG